MIFEAAITVFLLVFKHFSATLSYRSYAETTTPAAATAVVAATLQDPLLHAQWCTDFGHFHGPWPIMSCPRASFGR